MKGTIALLLGILLISSLASAQEIKKGATATVPSWTWVDVKNTEPVKSGNNEFKYNDSCGIQHGGTLTVIGIDGNRLLTRYSIGGTQYGTPCPSGIVFFIAKDKFSGMTAEYRRAIKAEKDEKALVQQLLKK